MWIRRDIENLVRARSKSRPVLVLTGGRQTGKTSLARRLFPDHGYVSLDLPSEAEQADRDPSAFLSRHPAPVVIDEVQYAPGLFRHLKRAVDAERSANGKYILTGSQRFNMMREVSDSLAGRADVIGIEGLTWREIHRAQPRWRLEEVVVRGQFPELYEKPGLDAEAFHRAYVATYLERDLRSLLNVGRLRDFDRFLRACALRSAQLLNRAELARDVGIAPSTAGEWLSVMEASGQITLLEPWFSNRTKSLVKTPKAYINDSGLCGFLVGLRSTDELFGSPLAGHLFETFVVGELRRQQINRRGGWSANFYRDRSREADLLLDQGGRLTLLDVKWTEQPSPRDIAALRAVAQQIGERRVQRLAILCRAAHRFPLGEGCEAMTVMDLDELA